MNSTSAEIQELLWPERLAVHFSSLRDDHRTPRWFLAHVKRTFKVEEFQDVACDEENAVSPYRWTVTEDSLKEDWARCGRPCWCNPPYGPRISAFLEKAYLTALDGGTVFGLLPARTDTAWFHRFVFGKSEVHFIQGRLRFSECLYSAPFPSLLAIWRPGLEIEKPLPLAHQMILPLHQTT
jgi:phage N-6-adenine-methyltransferase